MSTIMRMTGRDSRGITIVELAINVLFRALLDWAAICRRGDYPDWSGPGQRSLSYWQVEGFEDARAELEAFFRSDWCQELADAEGGYLAYLQTVKEIKDCDGAWGKRRSWASPCQLG